MIADFEDMIADFAVDGVQRIRFAQGAYDAHRRYIAGGQTVTDIIASFQPPTPAQMKLLPEGQRIEDVGTVYTSADLRSVTTPDGPKADRIRYQEKIYEVQKLSNWVANGNFTAAVCTLVSG